MNQLLNSDPTLNDSIPTGSGTEGHYRTIDDAFRLHSKYDVDSAFVTDFCEHDHIRQRAPQRDELRQHRMADKLMKGSQFSDDSQKDRYNAYLK